MPVHILSFIYDKPDVFLLTLFRDPGIAIVLGPLLFSFCWQHLDKAARYAKPEHYEDFERCDPLVNLGVHVASIVIAGLIYLVTNATLYTRLASSTHWTWLYLALFVVSSLYLLAGLGFRFMLGSTTIDAYYEIPRDQILPPFGLLFTWYRFGFAALSWSTAFTYMMHAHASANALS